MTLPDRLSIIVPTRDPQRPLASCLDTVVRQPLHEGDEVLVVGDTTDGPLPEIEATVKQFGPQFRYLSLAGEVHDYGHSQAQYAMSQARGDWLVFNDDDDVFTVGAFDAIRKAIAELSEPRPILFKFLTHYGYLVWDRKVIEQGHIGGHCIVCPNIPERLGVWTPRYEGDFDFIRSTLDLWPADAVVWNKTVIAVARPEQMARWA